MCNDFLCTIHEELHVYDCECPGIEEWAKENLDPYSPLEGRVPSWLSSEVK